MAEVKKASGKVTWIKVAVDILDDSKIKVIRSMKNGNEMFVIWIGLLCLAGESNADGALMLTEKEGYTADLLAVQLGMPKTRVKAALDMFYQLEMIDTDDDGIISIINWEKHQNLDKMAKIRESNRQRQRRSREKRKQEEEAEGNGSDSDDNGDVTAMSRNNNAPVTPQSQPNNAIEGEIEEEVEVEVDNLSIYLSKKSAREEYLKSLDEKYGDVENSVENQNDRLKYFDGDVLLSDKQIEDLMEKLSLEEFDKYVGVINTQIQKGKRYGKTHYQAILDMAEADRAVRA